MLIESGDPIKMIIGHRLLKTAVNQQQLNVLEIGLPAAGVVQNGGLTASEDSSLLTTASGVSFPRSLLRN